jgi:hypothetical protein
MNRAGERVQPAHQALQDPRIERRNLFANAAASRLGN